MSSSSESQSRQSTPDSTRILLVSCFGLGLAPVAPGTFGTLGGVALAVPLAHAPWLPYWLWLLVATGLLTLLGIVLGEWAERYFGRKDPGQFVIDEVAGYLVTIAVFDVFFRRPPELYGYVAAFLLFRAADILKPPPGRRLEALAFGLGVMLDDICVALCYSGPALALLGWMGFTWL
ncbi:MAG: phosphatidylglycerophosphatase A [Planctomycetota bacterium]